jgi:hypothetical protein
MLQFGAALAAASNPFCVNGEQFLSRNREMPCDMPTGPARHRLCAGSFGQSVGRPDRAALNGLRCMSPKSAAANGSWNFFSLRNVLLMIYEHDLFVCERDMMMKRVGAAIFAGSLLVGPAFAQSTTPSSEKQETSCTTSSTATSGSGSERTSNSMAVEKSAVLPDAGGSNSAAPTVQSGGKPLESRPDCPPDSKPK